MTSTTEQKLDLIINTIQQHSKILESFHTDIEWLKQNAATKKDLENVVTKQDLIAERKHTRQIIHEEISLNNKVFGIILKVELAEMKQDITTILQNHETRIQTLEERSLSKPNQN